MEGGGGGGGWKEEERRIEAGEGESVNKNNFYRLFTATHSTGRLERGVSRGVDSRAA